MFGNSVEQYAVHRIISRPEFDQIILVKTNLESDKINGYSLSGLICKLQQCSGASGNSIEANASGKQLNITLLKQLYLEFDDLRE